MSNEIVNKIAEWLQISVEKAIELYPQLAHEVVIYRGLEVLLFVFVMIATVCFGIVFAKWMILKELSKFKNPLIIAGSLSVLSAIITFILELMLTPNIIFFRTFIK